MHLSFRFLTNLNTTTIIYFLKNLILAYLCIQFSVRFFGQPIISCDIGIRMFHYLQLFLNSFIVPLLLANVCVKTLDLAFLSLEISQQSAHIVEAKRPRKRGLGLLTNRVERSDSNPRDHIYSYRVVFAYSHYDIMISKTQFLFYTVYNIYTTCFYEVITFHLAVYCLIFYFKKK